MPSAFDCAEILAWATAGQVRLAEMPLVRNMGTYICNVHIDEDRFVNFADAPATASPDWALCVRYGLATRNPALTSLGRYLQSRRRVAPSSRSLARSLPALFSTPAGEEDSDARLPGAIPGSRTRR